MSISRCKAFMFSTTIMVPFTQPCSASTLQMKGQFVLSTDPIRITAQLSLGVGRLQSQRACAVFPLVSPTFQSIYNKCCESPQRKSRFISADGGTTVVSRDTGERSDSNRMRTDLQVVLISPQIPGNTGCIARSCAAAGVGLHLVEPLGFEISSAKLKRAGLDYWPYVVVKVHKSWTEFLTHFEQQKGAKRLLGFTKSGTTCHTVTRYTHGDWLLFGSETDGLPRAAMQECSSDRHGGGLVRIPIDETYVRCLNLSVAAGIGLYEALRQIGYSNNLLQSPKLSSVEIADQDVFS